MHGCSYLALKVTLRLLMKMIVIGWFQRISTIFTPALVPFKSWVGLKWSYCWNQICLNYLAILLFIRDLCKYVQLKHVLARIELCDNNFATKLIFLPFKTLFLFPFLLRSPFFTFFSLYRGFLWVLIHVNILIFEFWRRFKYLLLILITLNYSLHIYITYLLKHKRNMMPIEQTTKNCNAQNEKPKKIPIYRENAVFFFLIQIPDMLSVTDMYAKAVLIQSFFAQCSYSDDWFTYNFSISNESFAFPSFSDI